MAQRERGVKLCLCASPFSLGALYIYITRVLDSNLILLRLTGFRSRVRKHLLYITTLNPIWAGHMICNSFAFQKRFRGKALCAVDFSEEIRLSCSGTDYQRRVTSLLNGFLFNIRIIPFISCFETSMYIQMSLHATVALGMIKKHSRRRELNL